MPGHDEAWVELKFGELCPICALVPQDAVAHTCGQLFCSDCWETWKAQCKGCAFCRQPGDPAVSHRDRRDILNLTIQCPKGCGQKIRLGGKAKHLQEECQNRTISCDLCTKTVTPATLVSHKARLCSYRSVQCPHCEQATLFIKLSDHSNKECPLRKVRCQLCPQKVVFNQMNDHLRSDGAHINALLTQVAELTAVTKLLQREQSQQTQESVELKKNLQDLQNFEPTLEEWKQIVTNPTLLRILTLTVRSLTVPRDITDADLVGLAKFQRLRVLNLSWCSNITDAGFSNLRFLNSLEHLDLSGCSNITDIGLDYVRRTHNPLQSVNVSRCSLITSEGLTYLRRLCRTVKTL